MREPDGSEAIRRAPQNIAQAGPGLHKSGVPRPGQPTVHGKQAGGACKWFFFIAGVSREGQTLLPATTI